MTVTINGTSGVTTPNLASTGTVTGGTFNGASTFGFKNRIINGAMVFDQRNAGASVTVNTSSNFYPVDRFACTGQSTDGVFTVQQSTTVPTGFKNSLVATVTTADSSIGATQQYLVQQYVEGYNVADLGWGTANAKTVTLSFWVYSSLGPGTFGGSIVNSGFNRSYPFTFAISAANTWEQKTVTITGDISGTWLTDSGVGLRIVFSLGAGSTYTGTAGAWAGTYYAGATGQTNVIATNGATFYITGVQLETGAVATTFDYRPYGTELALCQRYYTKSFETTTAPGTATSLGVVPVCVYLSGSFTWQLAPTFSVTMRSAPTVAYWDANGNASKVSYLANGTTTFNNNVTLGSGGPFNASMTGFTFQSNVSTNGTYYIQYTASSEL